MGNFGNCEAEKAHLPTEASLGDHCKYRYLGNKWGAHPSKNAFPDNKWGAHPGKTAFLDNKWVTLVTSRAA